MHTVRYGIKINRLIAMYLPYKTACANGVSTVYIYCLYRYVWLYRYFSFRYRDVVTRPRFCCTRGIHLWKKGLSYCHNVSEQIQPQGRSETLSNLAYVFRAEKNVYIDVCNKYVYLMAGYCFVGQAFFR